MQVEYKVRVRDKNIDPKLIVNEVRNGRSLESVQKLFGIRFRSEVQDLYMRGLTEMGEIPQVSFTRTAPPMKQEQPEKNSPVQPPRQDTAKPPLVIRAKSFRAIGESGTITLNKALLIEQLGFSVEDTFEIYREDDRIILRKTKANSSL
jgi:hypothetical protein